MIMVEVCSGEGVRISSQEHTQIQEEGIVVVKGTLPSSEDGEEVLGIAWAGGRAPCMYTRGTGSGYQVTWAVANCRK